jgi:DNA protecting protein DprA
VAANPLSPKEVESWLLFYVLKHGKVTNTPQNVSYLQHALAQYSPAQRAQATPRAQALGAAILAYGIQLWWTTQLAPALAILQPVPPILYLRGNPHALNTQALAIVGSRQASPNAKAWAQTCAEYWAHKGYNIVSGGAKGIDGAAHQGALDIAGKTVVVLGSAIDKVYPSCHRPLFQRILQNGGALLSEHPPLTITQPWHFSQRNRLIAGLVSKLIVVEASLNSGSLSCARYAHTLGRTIWVSPTHVGTQREGIQALLEQNMAQIHPQITQTGG